jgi:hypothetical protein
MFISHILALMKILRLKGFITVYWKVIYIVNRILKTSTGASSAKITAPVIAPTGGHNEIFL